MLLCTKYYLLAFRTSQVWGLEAQRRKVTSQTLPNNKAENTWLRISQKTQVVTL